jgi:uncharacterized damage-inducible protein DinB/predicted RNase H-like HicB family nuclease
VGEGGTGAFIPELPGCWVFARNEERALTKAKQVASNWYVWAKRHGESVVVPSSVKIESAEMLRVTYNPVKAGKPEPLFWSEVLPVSTRDVERTLRLMNHSRRDLAHLCRNLDSNMIRQKPKGGPRTIENCLRHIASVEWWYITRLDIDLPTDFPKDPFDLLRHMSGLAVKELARLTREQRTQIFQPHNDPSPVCNLWTARKVLRRFVDHERLHATYIERTLSEIGRSSA